jgi:hypothetical protein
MTGLLLVPPLRLAEFAPCVNEPSEQVVELIARRPMAVTSSLAAVVVHRELQAVALLEPVADGADGGYAQACIAAVENDLRARGVHVGRVTEGRSELRPVCVHQGRTFVSGLLVGRRDPAWHPVELAAGRALVCFIDGSRPEPVQLDPLVAVRLRPPLPTPLTPQRFVDAMLRVAHQAVAAHPYRFVIATGELRTDADGRRLLRWPGVIEQALADVRALTTRRGLPLWWDRLAVDSPDRSVALRPGGPYCADPLTLDLLGLGDAEPAAPAVVTARAAAAAVRPES